MSQTTLRSIVLIPKFTGGLSMIGSSLICWDILKDRTTKLQKVYHRLLLVMSVSDIFLSTTFFLSTWPIPKDNPDAPWLAAGNDATCKAQGFFMQFFVISAFYNAYLSIYYVLVIVHAWPEAKIVYFEYGVHAFSFLYACTTAFTALALDSYSSNFLVWCFIGGSWEQQLAFNVVWQWTAFGVVVFFMAYLWWNVRSQFGTLKKYGARPHVKASLKQSQQSNASTDPRQSTVVKRSQKGKNPMSLITTQAFLYGASFLLTESANVAVCIAYYTKPVGSMPLWVLQYGVTTLPLQGLWNCLIYFRPRYLQWKEQRQKEKLRKSHTLCISSNNQPPSSNTNAFVDGSTQQMQQQQQQQRATVPVVASAPQNVNEDEEFFDEEGAEDPGTRDANNLPPRFGSDEVIDGNLVEEVFENEGQNMAATRKDEEGNMVGPEIGSPLAADSLSVEEGKEEEDQESRCR